MGRYHLGLEGQNGLVDLELLIARQDGETSLKQAVAPPENTNNPGRLVVELPSVSKLLEHNIE